jgi:biotin transporter BioY
MIKQWWLLFLISIAGAVIVAVIGYTSFGTQYNMQSDEIGQPLGSTLDLLAIPFQAIGIISIILFIRILRQIATWQYRKSINV